MKLDELAKLAGVSRTTVSYVVNGKAKQYRVSDRTIEKVQSLIKQYNFKPNAMAAGLRAGRTYTIGLIIPDFENMSYARIAHRLEQQFRERGYQLLIACSNDNPVNEIACAKHLFQRKIDALIVSTSLPKDDLFYQNSGIPVFGFDRKIAGEKITNVSSDDKNDAYNLANNLFKLQNCSDILFLGALPELVTSQEREMGFRQALTNEMQKQVTFLYTSRFHRESAIQDFEQWLANNALPDALYVTSLTLLQGIFQVLLRRYHVIPSQLIIATFGDHEMLEVLPNKVLCVVQDHKRIADSLLSLVLAQLNRKPNPNNTYKILRNLVLRHC